jgi:hypothetical protein
MRLNRPSQWNVHLRATISLILGVLFACMSPNDGTKITSTSVSVGNPSGILVKFRDQGFPTNLSCQARIYAATQVPIHGFQSEPLAAFPLSAVGEFLLGFREMESIPDSLWSVGSIEGDSIVKFNIVLDGTESGAVVQGLIYHKRNRAFSMNGEISAPTMNSLLTVNAAIVPMASTHVGLPEDTLASDQDHYLFIPGTGYYSAGHGSEFNLILPQGVYNAALLSLPKSASIPLDRDSLPIIGLKAQLKPNSFNYTSRAGVIGWIPIPISEQLQRKWFSQRIVSARISFSAGGRPFSFTGNLELYASTQLPVPGFRPEPLKSFSLVGVNDFDLDSSAFGEISDSLWSAGSAFGDSIVLFNIFVAGKDSGSFLPGFAFHRRKKSFARSIGGSGAAENRLASNAELLPYDGMTVRMNPERLSPDNPAYLFVPGSGIVGRSDSGTFLLSAPRGKYALTLIFVPGPDHSTGLNDSVGLYNLRYEAATGTPSENAMSGVSGLVAVPDSFKK